MISLPPPRRSRRELPPASRKRALADAGSACSLAAEGSGTTLPSTSLSLSCVLPGDRRHQGLLFLESWLLEFSCRPHPFLGIREEA